MEIADFRRLFRYDAWANEEVLRTLRAIPEPPAHSVALLAHLAGAGNTWISRLRHETSMLAIWPELTFAECEEHLRALAGGWKAYLDELSPEKLGEKLDYCNSKGQPFSARVADILTHVINHGSYHRGQIAAEMRASGHAPAMTDYILAALGEKLD
jgi:uncharacterized damage-inducible protein DinB